VLAIQKHALRDSVVVEIRGMVGEGMRAVPSDRLIAALDDTESFLSSEENPVERGVSFHLARRLIGEIDGAGIEYRLTPCVPEDASAAAGTELHVFVSIPLVCRSPSTGEAS